MTKERDPLGKRALFSGAEPSTETPAAPPAPSAQPAASPPPARTRRPGPLDVTVECSGCHERSTTSLPEIALKHLPIVAWLPWRKQSLLMRCPACENLSFHSVSRP